MNDFPKQEMDSKPLPIESKLAASLAKVLTFRFTVSPNFEPVQQKGAALGGPPLPVYVVAPTELHDERTNGTSTRTKDLTTKMWISSWSEQYWRELICTSFTQSLKSTVRFCPLLVNDFPKQEILSRPLHRPFLPSRSRCNRMAQKPTDRNSHCMSEIRP